MQRWRQRGSHSWCVARALALVVGLAACAPAARPVRGPVGEAVRAALASGEATFRHEEWDRLLADATRDGLVDYALLQRRRAELDGYLERVAAADLAALHRDHLLALLANAYNACTVRAILAHPRATSIRDIPGVWTEARHRIGGYDLTLDEIEHRILRPFFRDPRVHFVLNCASLSCAPLPPWGLDGDRIDEQLEESQTRFLSDPEQVRWEDERLLLPRYFDWFAEDFTTEGWHGAAPSVADYVLRHGPPELRAAAAGSAAVEIRFLDYDWSLNAAVPPDPELAPPDPPQEMDGMVAALRRWVAGFGPLGPLVYGIVYVVATVAFIPGSALTLGAGVAFGLLWGTVVVWAGATVGAATCFLLSRTVLRNRVERWVAGSRRFAAMDRAVGREGWKIVALTRLSPVFPFNLLNYAFGLTGVGFWPYVLASSVAMLPGTVLYVYLGAAGAQVAEAAAGAAPWGQTALQGIGLAATLLVTLVIARIARRALREAEGDEEAVGEA